MEKAQMDELVEKYKLSPEDYADVMKRIELVAFMDKTPAKQPVAKIVMAQTGAGKSNLSAKILREDGNYVIIDADQNKLFRYDAEEIARAHPTDYGALTRHDSYKQMHELFAKSIKKGFNILFECAPSERDGVIVDLELLKKHGYKIDFEILAVSPLNSVLSTRERFEMQIATNHPSPKLTEISRHDDAYNGLMAVLKSHKYDHVNKSVYMRGDNPPPVCVNQCDGNIYDIVQKAQKNDEKKTIAEFDKRLSAVKQCMRKRHAPEIQFEQLNEIIKRYDKLADPKIL